MIGFEKHYLVDDEGNRIGIVLDISEYQRLLDEAEELESIRAYDAAKAADDEVVPLEQALSEIEQARA